MSSYRIEPSARDLAAQMSEVLCTGSYRTCDATVTVAGPETFTCNRPVHLDGDHVAHLDGGETIVAHWSPEAPEDGAGFTDEELTELLSCSCGCNRWTAGRCPECGAPASRYRIANRLA